MSSQTSFDFDRLETTYGDRLRKVRIALDMNQEAFAAMLGEPKSKIGAWELARNEPRNVAALSKRIQLMTGVSAAWLLGLTQNPRPDQGPDGDDGVRREGIEPPTRCFGAVDAEVIEFPGSWYGLEEAAA